MPTVMHFEIPADDVSRAKKFYEDLFGWEIKEIPGNGYWFITTSGEKTVNGGMMKRQNPQQQITNYVGVDSVDKYSERILKLGGKIIVPKTTIPQYGYFAVFQDTENNVMAIWQDDENAR